MFLCGYFSTLTVRIGCKLVNLRASPNGAGGKGPDLGRSLSDCFSPTLRSPIVGSVRHGQHGGHLKTLFALFLLGSGPAPSARTDHSHTVPSACALRGVGGRGHFRAN